MKRIMVVDDELLVRVGLKSMLDWEEKGYSIVCEAVSGRDAVEKLDRFAPDILLTDIVMEPMNGLELIKYCTERHPDLKIVVLSNYNDFEKVKAAMKFGARDFLFKLATSSTELLAILDGLSKEIDRQKQGGRRVKDAERLLNSNAGAIRQRLIDLMSESKYANEDDLLRELRLVDVKCDFNKPYALLYLAVASYHVLEALGPVSENGMLAVSLENVVAEIMEGPFASQTFRQENGRCIVVVNPEAGKIDENFRNRMREAFQRIDVCGKRYFGMRIRGVLSREVLGVKAFAGAVADCKRTLRESFLAKGNRLLLCPRERKTPQELKSPPDFSLSEWRIDLEHFQFPAAKGFIDRVLEHFYGSEGADPHLVRERLNELYLVLKNDGASKGIATDSLTDTHGLSLYQAISQYDLLSDIEESFLAVLGKYEAESAKIGGKKLKKEIARIVAGIHADPGRNLSVAEAAAMANMSESYFSHLFKSEMCMGFVDYVNHRRIEKAKEMLVGSDLRVNEIACRVGIENPNYFSILFKKIVKMSPVDFRNRGITE